MKGQQKFLYLAIRTVRKLAPVYLGVLSALITLELLLRVWSVVVVSKYTSMTSASPDDFVVLTLGESTTAGVTEDVWPVQLGRLLEKKYPAIPIRIVNKAVPGTNTSILVGNLERQIKEIHPDIIVSMMGINDAQRNSTESPVFVPNTTQDKFISQRFFRTGWRLIRLAAGRFFDLTINQNADKLNKKAEQYRISGEFELSEKYFLRCISLEPDNPNHYVMLAITYLDMRRLNEAERMLLKAKDVAPTAEGVYTELGNYYRDYGKLELAEEMFQKALVINPEYGLAYGAYATLLHWYKNDPETARGMYEKSIALHPDLIAPYFELADIYRNAHRYDDAMLLYEEVLRREPDNKLAKREIANTRGIKSGGVALGASVFAGETIRESMSQMTVDNYIKMIHLASRYHIPVVAVQYPLTSVESLQALTDEISGFPGVQVKVADNQKNFQEALKNVGYRALFTDYFGGNFGHTTHEGSRLIAESASRAVEEFLTPQTTRK